MQIDLHHTGIYVLCRIAGMKSAFAQIVAYASQQVDDATHGHALKFENGGAFRQTRTSDKVLSPKNLNINDALEVWMPFHFLPSGLDIEQADSQVCRTDSQVLKLVLADIQKSAYSPIGLYRLGIGLHCFADTYSHQDFKGFFDRYNMVTLLSGIEVKTEAQKRLDASIEKLLISHFPILAVGHGEVLTNPDVPYARWSYQRENNIYQVDNLSDRFIVALQEIHTFLAGYIRQTPWMQAMIEPKPFAHYRDKFLNVLQYAGTKEERHSYWLNLIRDNYFEFADHDPVDCNLNYDSREWFQEAVEVIQLPFWKKCVLGLISNSELYNSKPDFAVSHWTKFMHAAAEHQFMVLHKILPAVNLYSSPIP